MITYSILQLYCLIYFPPHFLDLNSILTTHENVIDDALIAKWRQMVEVVVAAEVVYCNSREADMPEALVDDNLFELERDVRGMP